MINIDKTFEKTNPINPAGNHYKRNINFSSEKISFSSINTFFGNIKYIIEYNLPIKKLSINFKKANFIDSATILLVCIGLVYLHKNRRDINIVYSINDKWDRHNRAGLIYCSPLFELIKGKISLNDLEKICTSHSTNIYINRNYFSITLDSSDVESTSKMIPELEIYIKKYTNDDVFIKNIKNVISELCTNALEHSKQDCLLYISVYPVIKIGTKEEYNTFNINIFCPSEETVYTNIKKRFNNKQLAENKVYLAYNKHKECFDEKYTENMFYIISAMQPHVTTRENQENGGTGLPTFLSRVRGRIEHQQCYLVCGEEVLYFVDRYIDSSNQEFGFNESGKYVEDVPNKEIMDKSPFYVNGLIYNIIMVKE